MTQNKERIFLSPPHLGDEELRQVTEAFAINYIAPIGPHLERFEADFCAYTGIGHAVALSSGTAAMHLALRELGVQPGDDVLVSTLTFIGSVSPVTFVGANPVFIDSETSSWNMDPALVEKAVREGENKGRLPAAVVPTDLYGHCADLDALQAICKPRGIPVIVDSAEALGAQYKGAHAGKGAAASVYSFNGNKIITTGGGGMLASDDPELIRHARHLSTQAREPAPWYEHVEIGYNYRLSNISAAIGIGQLQVLEERIRRKREIFDRYVAGLGETPGIHFMAEAPSERCNRWLSVMQLDPDITGTNPEVIRCALEAENIESRPLWKPMHLQPVFADARRYGGSVAESFFTRGLCLPSGTRLTNDQIDVICDIVRIALGQ